MHNGHQLDNFNTQLLKVQFLTFSNTSRAEEDFVFLKEELFAMQSSRTEGVLLQIRFNVWYFSQISIWKDL